MIYAVAIFLVVIEVMSHDRQKSWSGGHYTTSLTCEFAKLSAKDTKTTLISKNQYSLNTCYNIVIYNIL